MFRGGHAASPPCLLRGASRISASIQNSESGSRISIGNLKCVLAGLSFCYNRNLVGDSRAQPRAWLAAAPA